MKLKVHGLSDVKGCRGTEFIVISVSVDIIMVMSYVDGAATQYYSYTELIT